jgi:hypothetical protein
MNSSLDERRRRFRHLAETHPGLVVASALVEEVRTNARPERQATSLNLHGHRKSDVRSEGPARKCPTQLQFALWSDPKRDAELGP